MTIKAITNILEGGDYYPVLPVKSKWHDENAGPIGAFAWPLVVQAEGLVQLSGSKLQLTKAGRNALSQPASETLRRLWSKWIDTTIITSCRASNALANRRAQFRIAAENPAKMDRLRQLLEQHEEGRVLVIGEYIAQVEAIAKEIGAPLITGKTPQAEREQTYERFHAVASLAASCSPR